MTAAFDRYNAIVDELRECRRFHDGMFKGERAKLEDLEDLFAELTDAERAQANTEGWRGWPDKYDERMRSLTPAV